MSALAVRGPDKLQARVVTALLLVAALAWIVTRQRMLGMDAGPGTDPGSLGFYTVSWIVMMGAMMFPSIIPMVATFAARERRLASSWLFAAGYLLSWTVFGLLAYACFVGIRGLSIGFLEWHRGGRFLAGSVLLAAAIYQLTPAKKSCLRRCRERNQFIGGSRRSGWRGAVEMGVAHGAWCVGCCWALMAGLFALGVMSLTWMIVVAVLIGAERLLPRPGLGSRGVALALAVLGLGVALIPSHVPGLTLPGSSSAMHAMGAMHPVGSGHPMGRERRMGASQPMP